MKKYMIENKTIKINEGIKRISKDEMNLIELPFTLLTKRNPKELKTIERHWTTKNKDGKEKKFYKIITGSDKWGLPTFIGEEIFLACMELSHKQNFKSRKTYTTQYEIIKLLGWIDDGRSYERLTKAFNQLLGITITTNAFWDNESKEYKKIGFGIIDDYSFSSKEKRRTKNMYQSSLFPIGYFRWNEMFFNESIKKGNLKTLDIGLYFSLNSYVAKRLYRYADKKIYKQHFFEIDLFRLAFEKLEMAGESYKYPSKIIQNLTPAIKELKERNLVDIIIKKSKTESGYKVCFKHVSKSQITIPKKLKTDKNSIAIELVKYFHQQLAPEIKDQTGNDKEIKQAEELLSKYTQEEIEYIIDFAIDQAKKTKFSMQYLGAIINYCDNAIAQLKQETEQNKQVEKLKTKRNKQKQYQQAYDNYYQKQIDDYIKTIPLAEYEKSIADLTEKIFNESEFIKNKNSHALKSMVDFHFNQYLIEHGKILILPIEEWQKNSKNQENNR